VCKDTTTWENQQVKAMHWPKSRGMPSIDPNVLTFGTSVGDWRSINFAHCSQSIRPPAVHRRPPPHDQACRPRSQKDGMVDQCIGDSGENRGCPETRQMATGLQFHSGHGGHERLCRGGRPIQPPNHGRSGWYPSTTAAELHSVLYDNFLVAFSCPLVTPLPPRMAQMPSSLSHGPPFNPGPIFMFTVPNTIFRTTKHHLSTGFGKPSPQSRSVS